VIVFIHGVPETHTIWHKVAALVGEPSIALALPGFGNDRPHGFGATKDDYIDWIITQLDAIDEPIDLVGHDWGAAFTLRVATMGDVALRSWAADVTYLFHPDYVWHDVAQIWQQEGAGEEFWSTALDAAPEDMAPVFESYGLDHEDALFVARMADATMGRCVLDLYRSALPNPFADWAPEQWSTAAPGLAIIASEDPFGPEAMGVDVARRLQAESVRLEGSGHWWLLQHPEPAVDALRTFWATTRE
jgi:pimeloyl-ACP methyl ester carboxylesterase